MELEMMGDMPPQRFIQEGYEYFGEDGKWHLKEDAPDWAKKEFEEFYAKINPTPNESGMITQY